MADAHSPQNQSEKKSGLVHTRQTWGQKEIRPTHVHQHDIFLIEERGFEMSFASMVVEP